MLFVVENVAVWDIKKFFVRYIAPNTYKNRSNKFEKIVSQEKQKQYYIAIITIVIIIIK